MDTLTFRVASSNQIEEVKYVGLINFIEANLSKKNITIAKFTDKIKDYETEEYDYRIMHFVNRIFVKFKKANKRDKIGLLKAFNNFLEKSKYFEKTGKIENIEAYVIKKTNFEETFVSENSDLINEINKRFRDSYDSARKKIDDEADEKKTREEQEGKLLAGEEGKIITNNPEYENILKTLDKGPMNAYSGEYDYRIMKRSDEKRGNGEYLKTLNDFLGRCNYFSSSGEIDAGSYKLEETENEELNKLITEINDKFIKSYRKSRANDQPQNQQPAQRFNLENQISSFEEIIKFFETNKYTKSKNVAEEIKKIYEKGGDVLFKKNDINNNNLMLVELFQPIKKIVEDLGGTDPKDVEDEDIADQMVSVLQAFLSNVAINKNFKKGLEKVLKESPFNTIISAMFFCYISMIISMAGKLENNEELAKYSKQIFRFGVFNKKREINEFVNSLKKKGLSVNIGTINDDPNRNKKLILLNKKILLDKNRETVLGVLGEENNKKKILAYKRIMRTGSKKIIENKDNDVEKDAEIIKEMLNNGKSKLRFLFNQKINDIIKKAIGKMKKTIQSVATP